MSDMPATSYRFNVGAFECVAILDGTNVYQLRSLFGDHPREQLEPVLREYHIDSSELVVPYISLLINTGQHRVLVDTGMGVKEDEPDATYGHLQENLRAAGILPEDIDTVILSHGHPDHIGGTIDSQDHAAFPNARYVIWREEWEFWIGEPDLTGVTLNDDTRRHFAAFARDHLLPIQNRIVMVDPGSEIVHGVRALAAPGHTAGHLALAISSDGERLLFIGDAALHPMHLEHPDWTAPVDLRAAQTIATRRKLLDQAAVEGSLVHASHLPFPGLGRVIQRDAAHSRAARFSFFRTRRAAAYTGTWKWQPVGSRE